LIIGNEEAVIGSWNIIKRNGFDVLLFDFNKPCLIKINTYSCRLINNIPQKIWGDRMKDDYYPAFLNLFQGIPWNTLVQNGESKSQL